MLSCMSSESCLFSIQFILYNMDFHHRIKGKTGAGPISDAKLQQQQRDRLLKLAMETSDVSKVNIVY